jgi:hypothetical protein
MNWVVAGRLNFETGLSSLLFARKVLTMVRKSGFLSTSLYLKHCSTCLMRYYGGCDRRELHRISGPMVSLSRSGIPTIIPVRHRHAIMQRDDRADRLVRLYLSWFSICRIVPLAKKVSRATFSTIFGSTKRYRRSKISTRGIKRVSPPTTEDLLSLDLHHPPRQGNSVDSYLEVSPEY